MLTRIVVSREFRSYVEQYLGVVLGNDITKWRMMEYQLFSTNIDKLTGGLIVCSDVLASIEGEGRRQRQRRYDGEGFLRRLRAEGMPIDWWSHDVAAKRCRVLKPIVLPWRFHRAIEEELCHPLGADAVYFDDGSRFNDDRRLAETERQRRTAQSWTQRYDGQYVEVAPARQLLTYLNGLPSNRYTLLCRRMADAYAAVERITHSEQETRVLIQGQQRRILRAIETQPQPFYKPVKNSVRIFGANYNITGLKREVRRALTAGWYEADLKQSQLAICAALWPIPEVQAFLAQGGRIWASLFEHFDTAPSEEVKDIFKDALYAVLYGMSEDGLINGVRKRLDDEWFWEYLGLNELLAQHGILNGGGQFLAHPLIQAILAARAERMQRVIDERGVQVVFGQWLVLEGENEQNRMKSLRSLLVQEAQAMELALLEPIINLALDNNEFTISLWQHDGFSVAFRDRSRAITWLRRFYRAVADQAAKYHIITGLEVQLDGGVIGVDIT